MIEIVERNASKGFSMKSDRVQKVLNTLRMFGVIIDRVREEICRKVFRHYQKNPGSPWSGAPLRDLEAVIREFYSDLGVKYEKEFRTTMPEIVQRFYDTAVKQLRTAGTRRAILGKPDTARIKYFLESTFEQVAMRTQKMSFDHIRELRSITADVTRQMSLTGATRRKVSKELLTRALEIPGFEFIDNGGTKWSNKSYFNMLARTELMNAGRQTYFDTCAKNGSDVVWVTVSGNCCPKCGVWENRLLSISGATEGLPTVEEAMADGLCHPNCTHSFVAVPDYIRDEDFTENGRPKNGLNAPGKEVKDDKATWKQYRDSQKRNKPIYAILNGSGGQPAPKPDMSAWDVPEAVKQRKEHNREIMKTRDSDIKTFAAQYGMTDKEYIAAAEGKLQGMLDTASIYRRDRIDFFPDILRDGRFKSLFETGTSGGATNKPLRSKTEGAIFGYQNNMPDELRPLYGTINASPNGRGPSLDESRGYGEVICKLKNKVKERTTFTNGDSLGGEDDFGSCPVNKVNLTGTCSFRDILAPEVKSIDDIAGVGEYNEVQIHGKLHCSDIEKVFFEEKAVLNENFKSVTQELKKRGIEFEIIDK